MHLFFYIAHIRLPFINYFEIFTWLVGLVSSIMFVPVHFFFRHICSNGDAVRSQFLNDKQIGC